jgi:hypothetical protein
MEPATRTAHYLDQVEDDGFWGATEDLAHDGGEALPSAALTLASAGFANVEVGEGFLAGAVAAMKVASHVSNFSNLSPVRIAGLAPSRRSEVLMLSVPVDAGRRVALDPSDGRFAVFTVEGDGLQVTKQRWSGLDREERRSLEQAGIVDSGGYLVTTS